MARKKRSTRKRPARKIRKRATQPAQAASQGFEVPRGSGRPTARAATQAALPEDFHALYDRGFRASRGIVPTVSPQTRSTGHTRLAAEVPDLEVDYDQATQLPNRIVGRHPTARLATRAAASPEQAVTQFIQDRGDLWHLSPQDVATVKVVSTSPRGLPTVNLIQEVEGKEVFNSEVTASLSPNNEVVSIAGQFFPNAAAESSRKRALAETRTPEEEAIAKAATDPTHATYGASDFAKVKARRAASHIVFMVSKRNVAISAPNSNVRCGSKM